MSEKSAKAEALARIIEIAGKVIRPLDDQVLVERPDVSEKTTGGIVLPQATRKAQGHQMGIVLAVGPGGWGPTAHRIPMDLNIGDHVLFTKYAGSESDVQGSEILLMRRPEILAVIEDAPEPPKGLKKKVKKKKTAKKKTKKKRASKHDPRIK